MILYYQQNKKQVSLELMNRKRQKTKMDKDLQKNYVQNWSPHHELKQYNALQDPHANYYFYNKSVNQHLKQLKKAINKNPNEKQKEKMKKLINSKLNLLKLPNIRVPPKTVLYSNRVQKQSNSFTFKQRKKSQFDLPQQNKNKQHKKQASFSVVQMKRYQHLSKAVAGPYYSIEDIKINQPKTSLFKKQQLTKSYMNKDKQIQKMNQESHKIFLQFLVNKRSLIESNSKTIKKNQVEKIENDGQEKQKRNVF